MSYNIAMKTLLIFSFLIVSICTNTFAQENDEKYQGIRDDKEELCIRDCGKWYVFNRVDCVMKCSNEKRKPSNK